MVQEKVVLEHIVSGKGLEVDKAKIEVIQNLPLTGTIRDLRSFLGHVSFYQRFIQDFVKVSKPLTILLCKDKDFITNEEEKRTFMMLKQSLIEIPILQRSCATLRTTQWERSSGNNKTKSLQPYTMQATPWSKLK